MARYIKCPRCELNYIDAETQEYCDICLKEMKGIRTDADEIEAEEEAELPTVLCPVCGENMMLAGEKMCDECRKKAEMEENEPNPDDEDDDEWREYLDDDTDTLDDDMSELGEELGELEEEIDDDFEEEEEFVEEEEEDFDYVTGDEIYELGGDDEDDEDDEEDF